MGKLAVFEIPKKGWLFRVSHPEDFEATPQEIRDMAICDELVGQEIMPHEEGLLKLEFPNGIRMKLRPE